MSIYLKLHFLINIILTVGIKMLLTGGFTLTSGLTFTSSGTPVPPFIPLATLDPATASTELTLVGQTVTINTNTSNWAAICSTDGAWPLPTSTANSLAFTLELVMNATADNAGKFFMGTVLTDNYSNNTLQAGLFGPGGVYNYTVIPDTFTAYMYTDGVGFAFIQPGGSGYVPIQVGDILGLAVDISTNTLGTMEAVLYLNGNEVLPGYTFTVGVGTTGSITPFVAYSFANGSPSVTLRTNPATFSYANSYTNQNGWPLAPVVPPAGGNLVMTFNTSTANTVYLPLGGYGGTVNALINWADGNTELATTANIYSHTYAATGVYQVTITGTMSAYGQLFGGSENNPLRSVDSWDDSLGITNLYAAFYGAVNLEQVPNTLPSTVQFINSMFSGANSLYSIDLSGWNTSNVTGWDQVFSGAATFNGNISTWDTSKATSMQSFFYNCSQFNGNISSWNVANVTTMTSMFQNATTFNQDLSGWNVSNVSNSANHTNFSTGATAWQLNYQPTFPS
jgi:surface protein